MATGLNWRIGTVAVSVALVLGLASSGMAADEPDLIFKRSTVFKWLTPNDKLATYGLDDPEVDGVACHFTVPERGGLKGWLGVAEEVSDISLACRQIGPIRFKQKFAQGDDVFRQRRSMFFKKMQIVRGCDAKRNVLVYMVAEEFNVFGAHHALGRQRSDSALRRFRREVKCVPGGKGNGSVNRGVRLDGGGGARRIACRSLAVSFRPSKGKFPLRLTFICLPSTRGGRP